MDKRVVIGFSATAIIALPLGIFLTMHLQLFGSFLAFFVSGLVGGYISKIEEKKAFLVGFTGTLLACLLGIAVLLAVANSPAEPLEPLLYVASYILWLNVGSPVNLVLVVVVLGGIGGITGGAVNTWLKKREKREKEVKVVDIRLHRNLRFQVCVFFDVVLFIIR